MFKRARAVFVLVMALILGIVAPGAKVAPLAYADSTSSPYTATLLYHNDIQITYTLNYPAGGVWDGYGDIPMGGNGISDQIYCADPFIHFHPVVTALGGASDYDPKTQTQTDTIGNYVVCAPWNMSGAMKENYEAVYWIVANGFRGEYDYLAANGGSGQECVASLTRLKSLYPGLLPSGSNAADKRAKQISFMATKVAIWKVVAGANVTIVRTSLSSADEKTFFTLVDRMVADATAIPGHNGKPAAATTGFDIKIGEESPPAALTDGGDGFDYYGPLSVAAELKNSAGDIKALLDKVFLTLSGPESAGITFVDGVGGAALPGGLPVYGTANSAQYLDNSGGSGDFSMAGGSWASKAFYLKIPHARGTADYLTIKAMAKANDVDLLKGTPLTFVYENGAIQDWEFVQAFVGAAGDAMKADLFADAVFAAGDEDMGAIVVTKQIEYGSSLDNNTQFTFRLHYNSAADDYGSSAVVDLAGHPVYGAINVNVATGMFTLRNGRTAIIEGLPTEGWYWVEEMTTGIVGYTAPTIKTAGGGSPAPGPTAWITGGMQMDGDYVEVEFTNTKDTRKAYLYISKIVAGFIEGVPTLVTVDEPRPFTFELEYSDDGGASWNPVNLTGVFQSDGGTIVNAAQGRFTLKSLEAAFVEVAPGSMYRVTEVLTYSGYVPIYGMVHSWYENGAWHTVDEATFERLPDWFNNGDRYISEGVVPQANEYFWFLYSNAEIAISDLSVSKTVTGTPPQDDPEGQEHLFAFQLFFVMFNQGEPVLQWLTTAPGVLPVGYVEIRNFKGPGLPQDRIVNDGSGNPTLLMLKDGETAVFPNLPGGNYLGSYIVREADAGMRFTTDYRIGTGRWTAVRPGGDTAPMNLLSDTSVTFRNAYASTSKKKTNEKGGGGGGDGGGGDGGGGEGEGGTNIGAPKTPQSAYGEGAGLSSGSSGTGDSMNPNAYLAAMLFSAAGMAYAALMFIKRKKGYR
ncbi:MAG: DUF5979 domain-containing protein [Clostridiales bacterium]|nr:DUF5979 domain-containing protein [Clostridiales bacterium]